MKLPVLPNDVVEIIMDMAECNVKVAIALQIPMPPACIQCNRPTTIGCRIYPGFYRCLRCAASARTPVIWAINRIGKRAYSALHKLNNCWFVPRDLVTETKTAVQRLFPNFGATTCIICGRWAKLCLEDLDFMCDECHDCDMEGVEGVELGRAWPCMDHITNIAANIFDDSITFKNFMPEIFEISSQRKFDVAPYRDDPRKTHNRTDPIHRPWAEHTELPPPIGLAAAFTDAVGVWHPDFHNESACTDLLRVTRRIAKTSFPPSIFFNDTFPWRKSLEVMLGLVWPSGRFLRKMLNNDVLRATPSDTLDHWRKHIPQLKILINASWESIFWEVEEYIKSIEMNPYHIDIHYIERDGVGIFATNWLPAPYRYMDGERISDLLKHAGLTCSAPGNCVYVCPCPDNWINIEEL